MKTLVLTLTLLMSIPVFSATPDHGGPKKVSLKEWFNKNLRYPDRALENKEEGTVYVSFGIDNNGMATDIKVEQGISKALDEEAIELVVNMPLDQLTHKGFIEGSTYILPIRFVLK